jgi:glycosyltransferase involved in cell wall biosynthesis
MWMNYAWFSTAPSRRPSTSVNSKSGDALKIVLVAHHFPPHYRGGVELHTYQTARWLLQHGWQVEVVCIESLQDPSSGPEVSCTRDVFDDIPVNRLHVQVADHEHSYLNRYRDPRIGGWFEEYISQNKPDIIHIESCYLISASVIEAAHRAGKPVVVSLHDYWFICPRIILSHPDETRCLGPEPAKCAWCLQTEKRRNRLPDQWTKGAYGRMMRQVMASDQIAAITGWGELVSTLKDRRSYVYESLSAADRVVTPSAYVRELVVREIGLPEKQLQVIPLGLDKTDWNGQFSPVSDDHRFRIGFLGNVIPTKGVHQLLKAFKNLLPGKQEMELHIHGDIAKNPRYARQLYQIAGQDRRIHFNGVFDRSQIQSILNEIDVLVVPSTWAEIGPMVILEAFESGVPVVAADLPSMNTLVIDGVNGLLFSHNQVDDLSRQLQRLLDDPRLLRHLKAGIQPVKTMDQEMTDWMEIYTSVTKELDPRPL